jgi:uncharacterized membrane protein
MTGNRVQVFVSAFGDEEQASVALRDFRTMHRLGSIDLIDAAAIVHTADGKVKFEETADPGGREWAKRGAIARGLVGPIFSPSILTTAAVGAVGGVVWAKIRDEGIADSDLRAIGASLEPGTSAVIVIAEDRVIEQLLRDIRVYERLAQHA